MVVEMAAHHELPLAALESLLDQPETYRRLLGDYSGPVSLGISKDSETGEPCLLLRVANDQVVRQRELKVDGHTVRVIVRCDYTAVRPG